MAVVFEKVFLPPATFHLGKILIGDQAMLPAMAHVLQIEDTGLGFLAGRLSRNINSSAGSTYRVHVGASQQSKSRCHGIMLLPATSIAMKEHAVCCSSH